MRARLSQAVLLIHVVSSIQYAFSTHTSGAPTGKLECLWAGCASLCPYDTARRLARPPSEGARGNEQQSPGTSPCGRCWSNLSRITLPDVPVAAVRLESSGRVSTQSGSAGRCDPTGGHQVTVYQNFSSLSTWHLEKKTGTAGHLDASLDFFSKHTYQICK